jgi:hypothetical protein
MSTARHSLVDSSITFRSSILPSAVWSTWKSGTQIAFGRGGEPGPCPANVREPSLLVRSDQLLVPEDKPHRDATRGQATSRASYPWSKVHLNT